MWFNIKELGDFIKKIIIFIIIIQIFLMISIVYVRNENKKNLYGVAKASYFMGCMGVKPDQNLETNEWLINHCLQQTNNVNVYKLLREIEKYE